MANEVTIRTFEDIYQDIQTKLTSYGSKVTNFGGGGAFDLLIRISALMLADAYSALEANLNIGFTSKTFGSWLDLKAEEVGRSRQAATKCKKLVVLYRASTSGALQVPAGDICKTAILPGVGSIRWFSVSADPDDPAALAGEFKNGEATIDITIEADEAGLSYNGFDAGVPAILEIVSGFTGVDSITTTGSDSTPGTDIETDEELKARIIGRWDEIARGSTKAAYINFAQDSDPGVFAAFVTDNRREGPTGVEIVLSGPPGSRNVAAALGLNSSDDNFNPLYTDDGSPGGTPTPWGDIVHNYIRERAPLTDIIFLKSITTVTTTFSLSIKVKDGFTFADVEALVETRILAFFTPQEGVSDIDILGIGETLRFSVLMAAVQGTEGVEYATFTTPAAGVDITTDQDKILVATSGDITITEI